MNERGKIKRKKWCQKYSWFACFSSPLKEMPPNEVMIIEEDTLTQNEIKKRDNQVITHSYCLHFNSSNHHYMYKKNLFNNSTFFISVCNCDSNKWFQQVKPKYFFQLFDLNITLTFVWTWEYCDIVIRVFK